MYFSFNIKCLLCLPLIYFKRIMQKSKLFSELVIAFNLIFTTMLFYVASLLIFSSRKAIIESKVEVNSLVNFLFNSNFIIISIIFTSYACVIFCTSFLKNKIFTIIVNIFLFVIAISVSLYFYVIINEELLKISSALTRS